MRACMTVERDDRGVQSQVWSDIDATVTDTT